MPHACERSSGTRSTAPVPGQSSPAVIVGRLRLPAGQGFAITRGLGVFLVSEAIQTYPRFDALGIGWGRLSGRGLRMSVYPGLGGC
jgi:hypothetical protein